MKASLNHVAILLPSVQKAAEYLRSFGFKINSLDEFVETHEIYIGDRSTFSATLLLMQPNQEGSYTRAIKKRGPGLHHIAIDVLDLSTPITFNIQGSEKMQHRGFGQNIYFFANTEGIENYPGFFA